MKPAPPPNHELKWEYYILDCRGQSNEDDEEEMNILGEKGWELVGMSKGIAYFKRIKL